MTDARAKALDAASEAYCFAESDYMTLADPVEAAITAYLAAMAEAGYVVVPREATKAMHAAGDKTWGESVTAIYRAMIAEATRDKETGDEGL